jgi:hypothetical protein
LLLRNLRRPHATNSLASVTDYEIRTLIGLACPIVTWIFGR